MKPVRKTNAKPKRPLILVTNDDGVYSEGLRSLARALKKVGHVIIVAPNQEKSAASHSLTLHRPLRIFKIAKDIYAIDGTPTDCINLSINRILPAKPDVIVSGINKGGNLGDDVHYSGTVSAALEGCIQGFPAIAISAVARENFIFAPAARFAVKLVREVLRRGLPKEVMLNVNVPNLPAKKIRGYDFTRQGKRNYGDVIVENIDPRGRKYYWIGGDDAGFDDIPGSDCNAVMLNKITITPVKADLTDHFFLKSLKKWKL